MKRMLMLSALLCLLFGAVAAQEVETEGEKLERLRKAAEDFHDVDAIARAALKDYTECHGLKEKPDFAELLPKLAKRAVQKAEDASFEVRVEVGLRLHKDENTELGTPLLEKVRDEMIATGKHVKEVRQAMPDGTVRLRLVPDKTFLQVVEALGWKQYEYPKVMDNCIEYDVAGAREFSAYYNFDLEQTWRDIGWFPPKVYEKLIQLEELALKAWQELQRKDRLDGFALKARRAWIRFRQAHDNRGKVDREKGKRSFSPLAMERESEAFDNIWTYTYHKPFMVYVEKEIGQGQLDPRFVETLESKSALLRHLYDWFAENLINKFNLQRVKPQYNAEMAEKEGWPMEIVVLKDKATFEKFCADVMGQPMPGARAFYSPLDERVMTYDDTADMSADTQWFNESVLIHETFHLLSDHYAANPMFTLDEMMERPRYSSILVEEGLTDGVAGVVEEGDSFRFYGLNHLRLKDFRSLHEILGEKELFRLRDIVECRNYAQIVRMAIDRSRAEKIKVNMAFLQNVAMSAYYATGCQAAYFFQHYKKDGEYAYREEWWGFLKDEYQGKHLLKNYSDTAGVEAFKKAFEIEDDADWDAIEKEFIEFTLALEGRDEAGGLPIEEE